MKSRLKILLSVLACLVQACRSTGPLPEQGREGTAGGARLALARAAGLPESLPFHLQVTVSQKALARGLHSFAFGQADGKWLFVGGRTNGFHRADTKAFSSSAANKEFVVFDPSTGQTSTMPLPEEYKYLSANNMEYVQDGGKLYTAGGYGSTCEPDQEYCYKTQPMLTVLEVKGVIDGVLASDAEQVAASIAHIEDECFRVTGGVLRKVGDVFYLVFGHDYQGSYRDGNVGTYTEELRLFQVDFEDGKPVLRGGQCTSLGDATAKGTSSQYHRRDLNVTEAITPSGRAGLSVWGGVFTAQSGPWLNPIFIEPQDSGEPSIQVDTTFSQKTNVYECAHLLMYDPQAGAMYTTLFGGISYYYYEKGELVPGDLESKKGALPFTNIISTLVRSTDGAREYVQPEAQGLPDITGANAVFVLAPELEGMLYSPGILDLSKLPEEGEVLLGYIVGGIYSQEPHASDNNPTRANEKIYEVRLVRQ